MTIVADICSVPRWRTNSQFNTDTLPEALAEFQIGYVHIAELGAKTIEPDINGFWERCHRRLVSDHLIAHGETVIPSDGQG
ncbi:DUF488 domain-containing protein [Nitrobacter hamburgensis]|uniref:DUF488 domain-containing protein n=1 Tax=Nitrobacter hamburgensis TaxID=912 RepID=UPI0032214E4B